MNVVESLDDLQFVLDSVEHAVVVFSARDWCVPCQRLHPHIEAAADRLRGIYFMEVDADKSPEITQFFGIQSVPTVLSFKDGVRLGTVTGRTAPQIIAELSRS